MRTLVRFSLLVVALALAPACHPPKSVTSPQAKIAFTADLAITKLGEFQNAAIQANQTGGLDTATTKLIVTYVVDTVKTLKATPAGWQTTVQAGWAAFKPSIPTKVKSDPTFNVLISTIDTVIAGLQ